MNEKFGKLTVIERVEAPKNKDSKSIYLLCKCDCGNEKIVRKSSLTNGKSTSCGCHRKQSQSERAKKNATHGLSKTRFYRIWSLMLNRCENPNYSEFHLYGGRGIKVCQSWHTFKNFMNDMYNSYMEFEGKHGVDTASIDRDDSDGDYEPTNCTWKTIQEQQRNKRTNISVEINGITYSTIKEASEVYGINYLTMMQRYKSGKRDKELIAPTKKINRHKTNENL